MIPLQHSVVLAAAFGTGLLLALTFLVLASDGLRWYKMRHKRMARNDGGI